MALLDSMDEHRRSALHLAAFFGHTEAVDQLLESGADRAKEAMDGFLPLHFAAQQGHLGVLKALIKKVGAKDDHGAVKRHVNRVVAKGKRSALHLAVAKGHSECARFLAMKGSSVDLKTSHGETVLDLCKCELLRNELSGRAKVADSAPADDGDAEQPPAKRRAIEESKGPQAKESSAVSLAPPMSGLPAAPSAAAQALEGVLACGPFVVDSVDVSVAEGNRTYPSGVSALANVHWAFAVREKPGLKDGPVWSVLKKEICEGDGADRSLRLVVQKSMQKLLTYTHFSDEGKLLPKGSRCNACGLLVICETSDGHLVVDPKTFSPLETSDLAAAIKSRLCALKCSEEIAASSSAAARILALLDRGDDAPEGRRHDLVAGVRLDKTEAELVEMAGGAQSPALLHGSLDTLMEAAGADKSLECSLRLLRELRSSSGP
eukprot:TRINITY_DN15775_c0_g1_i1.p1 TRINITY_DN15775_c0_g1~~TRINITY_DN15775_c0_g1_i1.p1  ORF type:complete len:504 (-),score=100.18 TRINITY_DN15775_c0_g1_i1:41-1342(-)